MTQRADTSSAQQNLRTALFNGFAKAAAKQVREKGQKIHLLSAMHPDSMDLGNVQLVEGTVEQIIGGEQKIALVKVGDEDTRGLWL